MCFKSLREKQDFIDQLETLITRYTDDERDYHSYAIFLTQVLIEFEQARSAIKDRETYPKSSRGL
jgi:hypothetical protein